MNTQIFENNYIVNSFHATKPNGEVYPADSSGFITVNAGDEIVFQD